jgi:thiamine-phosphate pyrophosphorylase
LITRNRRQIRWQRQLRNEADVSTTSRFPYSPASQIHRNFHESPLYAILDTALRPEQSLAAIAEALLRAGVDVIQYRHKGKFRRRNFEECQTLAALIHRAGGLFLVNDRADVAALCEADGVHLGQGDLPPEKARRFLGAEKIIGYSTHTGEQVALADPLPVDYVAIGPVFPTRTKRNPDPVVGLSAIAGARIRTEKPLVGIGGITLENAPSVLRAGADVVAVISDLLLADDVESRAREFLAALRPNRDSLPW